MSTKERLHEIIDEMDEDQAEGLLMELDRPSPPLSAEDIASIERGRAELRQGKGIPHEEVLRRLGISG
jgi:hypothetical protein